MYRNTFDKGNKQHQRSRVSFSWKKCDSLVIHTLLYLHKYVLKELTGIKLSHCILGEHICSLRSWNVNLPVC